MKKLKGLTCLALSVMLTFSTLGLDVAASDVDAGQVPAAAEETNEAQTSEPAADKGDDAVVSDVEDPADVQAEDQAATVSDDAAVAEQKEETVETVVPERQETLNVEYKDGGLEVSLKEFKEKYGKGFDYTVVLTKDGEEIVSDVSKAEDDKDSIFVEVANAEEYSVALYYEKAGAANELAVLKAIEENTADKGIVGEKVVRADVITTMGTQLATPTDVKAVSNDNGNEVTITWAAVANADSYVVKRNDGIKIKADAATCTAKDAAVTAGTEYKYTIVAKSSDTTAYTDSLEAEVSCTPVIKAPGKVATVTGTVGAGCIYLTWSQVYDATGYYVYEGNKQLATLSGNNSRSYTVKTGYGVHVYTVRAYKTVGSTTVLGEATASRKINLSNPQKDVRTMSFRATVKKTCDSFTSAYNKKKAGKVKKGTKVTAYECYANRYRCVLPNGRQVWINKAKLKLTSHQYTTSAYSTDVLESFVNNKGYKSPSNFLIWINQYTQKVTIYTGRQGNWRVERSVKCATGQYSARTPTGTYKIGKKEKGWFYRTTYEAPVVHFAGTNSFHSRIKSNRKKNRGKIVDGRIGKPVSHGCIRMYDNDLNFIYKSIPKGTTVVSY